MKINTITSLLVCSSLLQHQAAHSFFNTQTHHNFMKKMHQINKDMNAMFDEFNQAMHEHTTMMTPVVRNRATIDLQDATMKTFQESASSMSFANQHKSVHLAEKHQQNGTATYTITVTQKEDQAEQNLLPAQALQKVQDFIQAYFIAAQAVALVQACIDAIKQDTQDQLVQIQTSMDKNQATYIIEISPKEQEN